MKVVNECRVNYKYKLSHKDPIIRKTVFSDIVSTQIIKDTLKISKIVNKKSTFSFDILTYTIVIKNIGKHDVKNILLKDDIPCNTKFVSNSVTVNKVKLRCTNPQQGIYIGNLKSSDIVEIVFKVLVSPVYCYNQIENLSTIEYDYIYNIEEGAYKVKSQSNKAITKYEKKVFKKLMVKNSLKTNDCIDKITDCKYRVNIIKTKIISNFNCDLYTLVVIGKIELKISYKSNCCDKHIEDLFGFSTFISVPIGIVFGNKDDIKYDIQYISTDIVNRNTVFSNITLILYY